MRLPLIKKCFGHTKVYQSIRTVWYNYLKTIPRRRLQRHGLAALKLVTETLQGTSAQYFADYGTLLGIIRDNGFIRHDDDIDFSVIAGSISPAELFKKLSKNKDFIFSHAFEFSGQITEMTFLYRKIEIDFFFCYVQNGKMLSPFYNPPPGRYRREVGCEWLPVGVERSIVNQVKTIDFKGVLIPVPVNYTNLLRDSYGDWETPVVGWSPVVDHGQKKYLDLSGRSIVVDLGRIFEIGNTAIPTLHVEMK